MYHNNEDFQVIFTTLIDQMGIVYDEEINAKKTPFRNYTTRVQKTRNANQTPRKLYQRNSTHFLKCLGRQSQKNYPQDKNGIIKLRQHLALNPKEKLSIVSPQKNI